MQVDFVLWHSWMCQNVVWKIVANVWSPTVKMQAASFCEALVLNLYQPTSCYIKKRYKMKTNN
jgi:hypothetical protein